LVLASAAASTVQLDGLLSAASTQTLLTPANIPSTLAPPVLTVSDVCVGSVDLGWTGTANDHYAVNRSTDGTNFVTVASVPASQTTFTDSGLANGTYFYKVSAFSISAGVTQTADSNIARATVGPVTINHFVSADNPGFTDHSDMQANGSAQFTANVLRLNNNFSQAGSAFDVQQVGIRGFTTTFQVQLHDGTQPNPADGFTFTIEPNSATALGIGGGGLGYQGIPNSVAVKFDLFDNEGESENSTGLFFNGDFPGLPHNTGEVNIPLDPNNVNLRSASLKTITLAYSSTTLTETIHDSTPGQTNNGNFTTTYTVDIAGKVGTDTAFAGFTGGTGGLFSEQDVLNWTYVEQEANLPPRAPTDLEVASNVRHDANRNDVTLTWKCNNAYTALGFIVERSTDGVNYTQIASLPTTDTSFTDQRVSPGAYYYRVRSFNAQGQSGPSNIATAEIHVPAAPLNLRLLNVFSQHIEIAWDPNSTDQSGFQVERSFDGVNFTAIGQVNAYTTTFLDVRLQAPVYYRVEALSAGGTPGFPSNTLTVDSVGQFISQDIGDVGMPGSATFDPSGTYTVTGSGSDIWDVADSFHYLYEPLSGDGQIVARIVDVGQTDFWTKAGVMIRDSLDPGAADAFMLETPSPHNEPVFQWRTDSGGFTSDSGNHIMSEPPAPIWLQLERIGNTFSGFWALDINNGQSHGPWQNLGGPHTVNMGANVLVGLALTAHNNALLNTSHFDHVQVTQVNPTMLQPPGDLTIAHVARFKSQSEVILAWQPNSDTESGFEIDRSTDGINFTEIATVPAGSTTFTDTNGLKGLAAGTYYYRVKAFATGLADSAYSNVDSVHFALPGQTLTISPLAGDLTVNGSAKTLPSSLAELTDGGASEAGSVFLKNRVGDVNFSTTFTFQMTPGTSPMADGMAFVIQGAGATGLGPNGGGLGYGADHVGGTGGLPQSVAIKFDLFDNAGEGNNSTGIFTDGRSPTVRDPSLSPNLPDTSISLDGSGINLASTHPFRVTLGYDGTTLTETITDTVTNASKTLSYAVNIPALIGSDVAYFGFTGGTGGLSTVANVQSWSLQTALPS
jgi:hypothetical protein